MNNNETIATATLDEKFVVEKINPIVGWIFHTARQLGSDNAPRSMDMRYLREGTEKVTALVQEVLTNETVAVDMSDDAMDERLTESMENYFASQPPPER